MGGSIILETCKAVIMVNQDVVFPYKVNTKAQGLGINKDCDAQWCLPVHLHCAT